jgi:hypothetical protein
MKVGSYQIALNDGKPQKMMEKPGGIGTPHRLPSSDLTPLPTLTASQRHPPLIVLGARIRSGLLAARIQDASHEGGKVAGLSQGCPRSPPARLTDRPNSVVHETLAGASAKFKGQKVDPRAKGKAKAVTKSGRNASKPVYQSTLPYSSRNGSVPGSPVSKKRKGVELCTPPAAPRQLSPRSIAMMSSSPSQAVGLGLGAGPNTPVDAATGCVFWPLACATSPKPSSKRKNGEIESNRPDPRHCLQDGPRGVVNHGQPHSAELFR